MSDNAPTWNEIKEFFHLGDIACMSYKFDLDDYQSVKDYITSSAANKNKILSYLHTGYMPQGGPQWDEDQFKRFEAWVNAGCPE